MPTQELMNEQQEISPLGIYQNSKINNNNNNNNSLEMKVKSYRDLWHLMIGLPLHLHNPSAPALSYFHRPSSKLKLSTGNV